MHFTYSIAEDLANYYEIRHKLGDAANIIIFANIFEEALELRSFRSLISQTVTAHYCATTLVTSG